MSPNNYLKNQIKSSNMSTEASGSSSSRGEALTSVNANVINRTAQLSNALGLVSPASAGAASVFPLGVSSSISDQSEKKHSKATTVGSRSKASSNAKGSFPEQNLNLNAQAATFIPNTLSPPLETGPSLAKKARNRNTPKNQISDGTGGSSNGDGSDVPIAPPPPPFPVGRLVPQVVSKKQQRQRQQRLDTHSHSSSSGTSAVDTYHDDHRSKTSSATLMLPPNADAPLAATTIPAATAKKKNETIRNEPRRYQQKQESQQNLYGAKLNNKHHLTVASGGYQEGSGSFLNSSEIVCHICADEHVRYTAVGACDHHICSVCAVRMRCKNKDKSCALCKRFMPVMLVCATDSAAAVSCKAMTAAAGSSSAAVPQPLRCFAELCHSFGLEDLMLLQEQQPGGSMSTGAAAAGGGGGGAGGGETDIDCFSMVPRPGVDIDSMAAVIFVDCTKHSREIEKLRSIACPVAGCRFSNIEVDGAKDHGNSQSGGINSGGENDGNKAVARFATNAQLLKHMKEAHSQGGGSFYKNGSSSSGGGAVAVALCSLCVEHRSLFTCEQTLFSPKQLTAHLLGETEMQEEDQHGDHIQHRRCDFCRESLFDSAALYHHMQLMHYTCHLCPQALMFRYYDSIPSLHIHFRAAHFVCRRCDENPVARNSGEAFAFSDHNEYNQHLKDYHYIRNNGSGLASALKSVGANDYGGNAGRCSYFDLDMGTASPFLQQQEEVVVVASDEIQQATNARRSARSMDARGVGANIRGGGGRWGDSRRGGYQGGSGGHQDGYVNNDYDSEAASLALAAARIPANMRIAGRVTGSGQFAGLSDSDRHQQELVDRAHALAQQQTQHQQRLMAQAHSRSQMHELFPSLSGGDGGDDTIDIPKPPAALQPKPVGELHPMSMMHSRKQKLEAEREQTAKVESARAEAEQQRIKRSLLLADCFLGSGSGEGDRGNNSYSQNRSSSGTSSSSTGNDAASVAVIRDGFTATASAMSSYSSSSAASSALLVRLGIRDLAPDSDLLQTLYPPQMLPWARTNKLELLKIEKKISNLLSSTDAAVASIQLKPMAKSMRQAVHSMARFYGLNSSEYDPEPKRYVSLVRTVNSCLPNTLLSMAANQNPMGRLSSDAAQAGGVTSAAVACLCKIPHLVPPESANVPVVYLYLHVPPVLSASTAAMVSVAATAVVVTAGGYSSTSNGVPPVQHAVAMGSGGPKATATTGVYTVADVVTRVRALLYRSLIPPLSLTSGDHNSYQQHSRLGLRGVRAVGPSTVALEFITVRHAARAYRALQNCINGSSTSGGGTTNHSSSSSSSREQLSVLGANAVTPGAEFLADCFYLYPEFEPIPDEDMFRDERDNIEGESRIHRIAARASATAASDGSSGDIGGGGAYGVAFQTMPVRTGATSSIKAPVAVATDDDSVVATKRGAARDKGKDVLMDGQVVVAAAVFDECEAAALKAEWEEFLADHRSGGSDDAASAPATVTACEAADSGNGSANNSEGCCIITSTEVPSAGKAALYKAKQYGISTNVATVDNGSGDDSVSSSVSSLFPGALDSVPRYKAKRRDVSDDYSPSSSTSVSYTQQQQHAQSPVVTAAAIATEASALDISNLTLASAASVQGTVYADSNAYVYAYGDAATAPPNSVEAAILPLNRKQARKQQQQTADEAGWQTKVGIVAGGGVGYGATIAAAASAADVSSTNNNAISVKKSSNKFAVLQRNGSSNSSNSSFITSSSPRAPPIPVATYSSSSPHDEYPALNTSQGGNSSSNTTGIGLGGFYDFSMVASLCNLGFDESSARAALRQCNNNVEDAANFLLGQ